MNITQYQVDGLKAIIVSMAAILLLLFVPVLIFAIKGNDKAVAVCLTVIAMLFLGIVVMGAVAAGATWTRNTMRDGANIALAAQESDDRRDIKQMDTLGKLMIEGGRIAQRMRPGSEPTALPLPSQALDWLPEVSLLEEGDVEWEYVT